MVNFHFPVEQSTYEYLSGLLGVSAQEAKELTFKQLYGGVFEEYKSLLFFQKIQTYVQEQWKLFNEQGFINAPISNYRFEKDKLENMNPQKVIQLYLTKPRNINKHRYTT